ncbi:hypothetical protein [Mycobacterium sp.]|uniref:hypothetical protein n=1 Tax=Mycobacterium sp. TaxID=1785 RepID=UPI0039C92886
MEIPLRLAIAATLAVSGVIHAYLYIHGYNHIPTIGPAFLLQASLFCALAVLILVGAPEWFRWAGAALSAGTLIAFALSRTTGLFGFTEDGWNPSPQAALSVIAEALTVMLVAAAVLGSRAKAPAAV